MKILKAALLSISLFLAPLTSYSLNLSRLPASESPLQVSLDLESSVAEINKTGKDGETEVICDLKNKLSAEIKELQKQTEAKVVSKNLSSEVKQKIAKACGV